MRSMRKTKKELEEEMLLHLAKEKTKLQRYYQKKYEYLGKVPPSRIQYEYLKAQAQMICELDMQLRLSPFKSFYSVFLSIISEPDFLEKYYLKFNEYGILVVDEDRLHSFTVLRGN